MSPGHLCALAIMIILLPCVSKAAWGGECVNRSIDPALKQSPPSTDRAPVILHPSLYVTNLAAINEAEESFAIDGYMKIVWHDNRLAVGVACDTQVLSEGDIWMPSIEMANAQRYKRHSYTLKVDSTGLVSYTERFDADLSNHYGLRQFPFDRQVLMVVLEPFLSPEMTVVFSAGDLGSGLSGESIAGLAAWSIEGITYVPSTVPLYGMAGQIPEARFDILVARKTGFYIWKVFLPMILMAIIPWSVFWVDAKEFDWQMKIPIATMLALIAFEFAVSRDLPRVPYITFLDAVFLTCFLFVFLSIVEIVAVYALINAEQARLGVRLHWHARWAVPLVFVCTLALLIPAFFHSGSPPL